MSSTMSSISIDQLISQNRTAMATNGTACPACDGTGLPFDPMSSSQCLKCDGLGHVPAATSTPKHIEPTPGGFIEFHRGEGKHLGDIWLVHAGIIQEVSVIKIGKKTTVTVNGNEVQEDYETVKRLIRSASR